MVCGARVWCVEGAGVVRVGVGVVRGCECGARGWCGARMRVRCVRAGVVRGAGAVRGSECGARGERESRVCEWGKEGVAVGVRGC